jgi:triosephosphate isomerase
MAYIFANWKMYLGVKESVVLAKEFTTAYEKKRGVEVALFPSALAMTQVVAIAKKKKISVGAQNCAWTPSGAYTGAVSAQMFRDAGCAYALVGHSERRHVFGESDSAVRKKVEACFDAGLTPVLCIGETKEEKDAGKRQYRLKKQLMSVFQDLDVKGKRILVAYEPVWAIGTGEACAPADADDVHQWVKEEIGRYTDTDVPVLYGGSVDENNAALYLELPSIQGLLVGSASTKKKSFLSIIRQAV